MENFIIADNKNYKPAYNQDNNLLVGGLDSNDYETIILDHDEQKDIVLSAMEVVLNFIKEKKRILTGGMAIDMALKKKGSFLYKDNKIPDYDFYSPEFHKDAYDIGTILSQRFNDISVINAMHISTMRVRVNFVVVADITYIPLEVYNNIPTLVYNNLYIVHPFYQMIDQHLSLSLGFKNSPKENLIDRWEKDIKRYDMLNENYPIENKINADDFTKLVNFTIKNNVLKDHCIGGIPGLLFWLMTAKKEGMDDYYNKKLNITTNYPVLFKPINLSVTELKVVIPVGCNFTIITDEFETIMKKFKGKVKYYNELIDKIPRKVIIDNDSTNIEIIDSKGLYVAAYKHISEIYFANLQYIMCYLLTYGIFYKNDICLYAYKIAQDILFWASDCYKTSNTNDKKMYEKYLPTVEFYGSYNISNTYINMLNKELVTLREKENSISIPKAVFPTKDKLIKPELYDFNPSESLSYQTDGKETNKFEPLEL